MNTAAAKKQQTRSSRSDAVTPPYTNTIARIGKLDTTMRNMVPRAASSFPRTMSAGVMQVVSIKSSVWRSRSPLMLPAVIAGMIRISIRNSRDATNMYRSRNPVYCTSAVSRTWARAEYIFNSATRARIPLNTSRTSASLKLRALTMHSRL